VTTDWIVVSDPLATVTDDAGMFYWQQYLGLYDYAVQAFKTAAQHTKGKLYIGMGGLVENPAMCQQLVTYMQAIEAQGARVDGIAVNIEANTETTNIEYVRQMFKQLAATGKLVRIADLQVTIGDGVKTDDIAEQQLRQQSTLMTEVLKAYSSEVPDSQRGGVTLHQTLDTVLPLGLWNRNYERKHAYGAVCASLMKSE
jgi:GH35 family endo-1,4-beta-xylanase